MKIKIEIKRPRNFLVPLLAKRSGGGKHEKSEKALRKIMKQLLKKEY